MGYVTEFNWALRLKPEQGLNEGSLKEGSIYEFEKEGYRTYPVGMPIDLVNNVWEAVAKVIVVESMCKNRKTRGKYKVVKIYKGTEKVVLTNYWRETVQLIKGEKITDFSGAKVS